MIVKCYYKKEQGIQNNYQKGGMRKANLMQVIIGRSVLRIMVFLKTKT